MNNRLPSRLWVSLAVVVLSAGLGVDAADAPAEAGFNYGVAGPVYFAIGGGSSVWPRVMMMGRQLRMRSFFCCSITR